jgi:hypothetical protein
MFRHQERERMATNIGLMVRSWDAVLQSIVMKIMIFFLLEIICEQETTCQFVKINLSESLMNRLE